LRIAVGTRKIEVAGDEDTDGCPLRNFYRRRDVYVPLQGNSGNAFGIIGRADDDIIATLLQKPKAGLHNGQ
jgi:hypothetical protein